MYDGSNGSSLVHIGPSKQLQSSILEKHSIRRERSAVGGRDYFGLVEVVDDHVYRSKDGRSDGLVPSIAQAFGIRGESGGNVGRIIVYCASERSLSKSSHG